VNKRDTVTKSKGQNGAGAQRAELQIAVNLS